MSIDSRYLTLLDAAGSEAKRLGSDECLDVHVALALVRQGKSAAKEFGVSLVELEVVARDGRPEKQLARELLETATGLLGDGQSPDEVVVGLIKRQLNLPAEPATNHSGEPASAFPPPAVPGLSPEHPAETDVPNGKQLQSGSSGVDASTVEPSSVVLVGRASILEELDALTRRSTGGPIVVHGRPGSGRSSVLRAFADRLRSANAERVVRYIPATEFLTDPPAAMALARSASAGQVFLLDDLDLVLALEQEYTNPGMHAAIVALLAADGPSVVVALPTALRGRFEMTLGRLAGQSASVEVTPLSGGQLDEVLANARDRLSAHHGVVFDDGVGSFAAAPPAPGEVRAQPALGIRRLDEAAATAAAAGRETVSSDDVLLGVAATPVSSEGDLGSRLSAAVIGQDHAVDRLAQRLLVTRAGLDLRPERPDGVFLFVGPSGVGKTALARALSLELFGSESKLIRLDMSEYSEPWAIARLIGPQPGYVGSTEPESWLTTKIRNQPDSVLLLDEVEKAHPDVWNVFLQVFDAGRLTDSKGEVADFSSCVVIMTSNLGTGVSERRAIGFTQSANDEGQHEARVIEVVKESMRPELLNRLDSTVVFRALDRDAILAITRSEIERIVGSLGARGFALRVSDDVVRFIADDGYDETYGARHVQRSIERNLLEELARRGKGRWQASMAGDAIAWQTTEVV